MHFELRTVDEEMGLKLGLSMNDDKLDVLQYEGAL